MDIRALRSNFTKFFIISYFLLNASFLVFSQNTPNNEVKEIEETIIKLRNKDVQKALFYIKKLMKIGKENNDNSIIGKAYIHYGVIENNKQNTRAAIDSFNKGLEIITPKNNNRLFLELMTQKGNSYLLSNEYKKALQIYFDALDEAKKSNNNQYVFYISINLALARQYGGDLKEALTILRKSYHQIENRDTINSFISESTIENIRYSLSSVYLELNELDSSKILNSIGLEKSYINNDILYQGLYLTNEGIILFKEKKYKKAEKTLYKSNEYLAQIDDNQKILLKNYFYIGSSFFKLKQYDNAIKEFNKVLDISKGQTYQPIQLKDTYKLLADCYKQKGNNEKSILFYEKYSETSTHNDKNEVSKILHKREFANYSSKIEKLSTLGSKQKKYIKHSLIIFGIIVAFLIVIIIRFISLRRKNITKFNELITKIDQLETKSKENISIDTIFDFEDVVSNKDIKNNTNQVVIKDEKIEQILKALSKLKEQGFFFKQDCNLYTVAKKINTNTSYLSKIINNHEGKKFNTYINDIRINYAIKRLKTDPRFRMYSIKSISEELGYKTSDSFSKYFKLHSGIYPSFFIKTLNSSQK